jgi:hypothetical protein
MINKSVNYMHYSMQFTHNVDKRSVLNLLSNHFSELEKYFKNSISISIFINLNNNQNKI